MRSSESIRIRVLFDVVDGSFTGTNSFLEELLLLFESILLIINCFYPRYYTLLSIFLT